MNNTDNTGRIRADNAPVGATLEALELRKKGENRWDGCEYSWCDARDQAIQDRLLGMFYWVTLSPNGRVRLRHISKKRPGKNHDSLTAALEWAVEQEGKTG